MYIGFLLAWWTFRWFWYIYIYVYIYIYPWVYLMIFVGLIVWLNFRFICWTWGVLSGKLWFNGSTWTNGYLRGVIDPWTSVGIQWTSIDIHWTSIGHHGPLVHLASIDMKTMHTWAAWWMDGCYNIWVWLFHGKSWVSMGKHYTRNLKSDWLSYKPHCEFHCGEIIASHLDVHPSNWGCWGIT